jgi:hypothetical protein
MGQVDKTLFLHRQGDDILIVQVYVNDIVFRASSHCEICRGHEQRIRNVHDGRVAILSQASDQAGEGGNLCASSQVHKDILKKFKMDDSKPLSTPMSMTTALDADEDGEP